MKNVLVFNCGSSSLKYKWIEMPSERVRAGGEAQRVGPKTAEPSRILHRVDGRTETVQVEMSSHARAFEEVMKLLLRDVGCAPDAMGHRLVHGGAIFSAPARIGSEQLEALRSTCSLAPLHNPPAVALLETCRQQHPEVPQVAVFDTAFHATLPPHAHSYALPGKLTQRLGVRKYGFHGTSHRFVAQEAARSLGIPLDSLRAVSCHLGSGGASLCAILDGHSVDNTMGFSPLQGLVMSTRCGDLDPSVVMTLVARSSGDTRSVESMLNKKSGVLGLSGLSADIRDVLASLSRADHPQPRLSLTAQIYLWRIRKYLGAYLTVAAPAQAILFTDTIGETSSSVRAAVCADMQWFGLQLDPVKNENPGPLPADVASPGSSIRILVVETNEELAIARETLAAVA